MTGCRGQGLISSPSGTGKRLAAARNLRTLSERGFLADFENARGIQDPIELDELGDEPCPAGLVTGAQPGAVVGVEVLVEEDVIAPVGIGLELLAAAVARGPAMPLRGK